MSQRRIDGAFAYLSDNVLAYTDLVGKLTDEDAGVSMLVEELSIETPVELDVHVSDDGQVELGVAPPVYPVDLGVDPVRHRLRFTAVAELSAPADTPDS